MGKLFQVIVALGVLLAGGGMFYHYVFFLPAQAEQRATEAAQKAAQAAQKAAQEKKAAVARRAAEGLQYQECMYVASADYNSNWAAACKLNAAQNAHGLRGCLLVSHQEAFCKNLWGKPDASPNCTLPGGAADSINKTYKEEKAECLTQARAGLTP
ncbi:MAG TPA: hypothetical protein VFQ88_05695 [Nevskiaceae bacterium]|nr:hypothetical protein [Nevskiaceae bacterium]